MSNKNILIWLILLISSCSKSPISSIDNHIEITNYYEIPNYIKGVDLSYVNQIEDNGGKYFENGRKVDPFEILSRKGANVVRLRLWHNPLWHQNETIYGVDGRLYSCGEDIKKSIRRAKDSGMAVLLGFHYSDSWADPGNQEVPEAWKDITSLDILLDSIYFYTYNVLEQLMLEDLLPEIVQLGNEINCGMLFSNINTGFPFLNVCENNWNNMGQAVNAAIRAVRDIDKKSGKKSAIALHVANPISLDSWFTNATSYGKVVDFDMIGVSYYHIWHSEIGFESLPKLIQQTRLKFNKDVLIMETAYPFTSEGNDDYGNIYYDQPIIEGFEYSEMGQYEYMKTLNKNMSNAGAKGVFYWEPTWISSSMKDMWGQGSSWENCAFFDFDGEINKVVEYLSEKY